MLLADPLVELSQRGDGVVGQGIPVLTLRISGILELPVTPLLGHLNLAIGWQQPHDVPNLRITPLLPLKSWVVPGYSVYLAMCLGLFAQEAERLCEPAARA